MFEEPKYVNNQESSESQIPFAGQQDEAEERMMTGENIKGK